MSIFRAFKVRWYHLLLALGALIAVIFVLVRLFRGRDDVRAMVKDKSDLGS